MVFGQIIPHAIRARNILDAFMAVPRERFVPPKYRTTAYHDGPIPMPHGGYLLAPIVTARMLSHCPDNAHSDSTDDLFADGETPTQGHALVLPDVDGYAAALLRHMGYDCEEDDAHKHKTYHLILIEDDITGTQRNTYHVDKLLARLEVGGCLIGLDSSKHGVITYTRTRHNGHTLRAHHHA